MENTSLQRVFDYQGSQVRTVLINDEPWWIAKDICEILDLDSSQTRRLDDDEKGLCLIQTLGGPQEMLVVNEPGLYSLILGSRKPEAKEFKRWITHEVIPAIRKTGMYIAPTTPTEALLQAVQILDQHEKQLRALEEKVLAANHRIDNLDAINTIGDPQQRLNAIVRKYALDNGFTFAKGWSDFKRAFNTAFHTNIEMRRLNHIQRHGPKNMTIPQYLVAANLIQDAIRVADKMLNRQMEAI